MSTITTRADKGSPLTNAELDANFSNLNTDKLETSEVVTTAAANKVLKLNASSQLPASITGNAATATTLQTARTIGGVSFNGSANINLPGVNAAGNQNTTGSAAKWTTACTLSYTGDATGSGSVDGSANVATALTLANSGVTAGTYTKVTVDAKGRATSGTTLAATDIPALDASKITSGVLDAARLPSYVDDVLEYANLAGFPATGETGKIYVALDTNKTYRWSGSAYVYITSGAVDSVAGKTGVVTLVKGDVGLGSVDNTADAAKNVLSATKLTTARTIGGVTFDGSANINLPGVNTAGNQSTTGSSYSIVCLDTRATAITPQSLSAGLKADFKTNTTDGLADGGSYHGVLSFRQYSTGTDVSGGLVHQLGLTDNGNIWQRTGSGGTNVWGSWKKVLNDANYNDYAPTKTGTGASGTWGISVSGNAATATTATNWTGMPSGTRMPFAQASAPTGWTQDVSDNADNRMLRVVNTTGNGIGGSHSPILNNVVPSHTHGFSTGTESADHSHAGWTGGQNTNHAHPTVHVANYHPFGLWPNGGTTGAIINTTGYSEIQWEATGGVSADHAHYITTGGRSAAHTHSGSTDNGSSQTNWTPRYINMIICSKN